MSLRNNVSDMIAERLLKKGNRRIDDTGLRKRPQMEQIVSYLESGQERVVYPDRLAKLIRNHPFMTQLDFFDMQEDQERAWEEQNKKHRAEEIAKKSNMSAAEVRAEGTQTDKPQTFSRATDVGTQFFDISDEHEKMTSDERARQEQKKTSDDKCSKTSERIPGQYLSLYPQHHHHKNTHQCTFQDPKYRYITGLWVSKLTHHTQHKVHTWSIR